MPKPSPAAGVTAMKMDAVLKESFAPGFLVASPRLDGSPFERALIVMVHHDEEGAMGFIVNKPLSVDLGSLLETADEKLSGEVTPACFELKVQFGGPVRVEQLWLIYEEFEGTHPVHAGAGDLETQGFLKFDERWGLVADSDSIEAFVYGQRDNPYRPFIGYTGWGPGQLEEEIDEGSWLLMDFEQGQVFDEGDAEGTWQRALASMGVNPLAFLMMAKAGRA